LFLSSNEPALTAIAAVLEIIENVNTANIISNKLTWPCVNFYYDFDTKNI
jgi:hypothetical protein